MEVNYRQNFQKMDGEMKKSAQKKGAGSAKAQP
jgi:hypothetical protein